MCVRLQTLQPPTMSTSSSRTTCLFQVISQTAIQEFKAGSAERGRSMFEGCLRNYPARLDVWSQYLDQARAPAALCLTHMHRHVHCTYVHSTFAACCLPPILSSGATLKAAGCKWCLPACRRFDCDLARDAGRASCHTILCMQLLSFRPASGSATSPYV